MDNNNLEKKKFLKPNEIKFITILFVITLVILVIVKIIDINLNINNNQSNNSTTVPPKDEQKENVNNGIEDEYNTNDDSLKNDNTNNGETMSPSIEEIANKLMERFSLLKSTIACNGNDNGLLGYFYQNEKYTVDTISDQAKIFLAVNLMENEEDNIYNEKKEISIDMVEKYAKKIFGNDVKYSNENAPIETCGFPLSYNKERNVYVVGQYGCGGSLNPMYVSSIVDVKNNDNILEITEIEYYVVPDTSGEEIVENIYKKLNGQFIGKVSIQDDVFAKFASQLDSYKYTFVHEDNEYYLTSVELIK